jgi:hypothetical protein
MNSTPPRTAQWTVLAVGVLALLLASLPGVGRASVYLASVVRTAPEATTPHAVDAGGVDSDVDVFTQVGGVMYAGGRFTTVQNPRRTTSYTRNNIFAFNATSGVVGAFAPNFNGRVWAIVPGPDNSLLVGGEFTTVNGTARRSVAKIDATTGALDTRFSPAGMTSGGVTDAQMVAGRLIVSGSFPRRLLALNPRTGSDTRYLAVAIAGQIATNSGPTKVYRFAVDPAGTRLVGIGDFTSVGGVGRRQAFMLNLGGTSATVSSWYDRGFNRLCASTSHPSYLRDVDFSPDGTRFGFAATGFVPQTGDRGRTVCDAAALYRASDTSSDARALWINYTGGDTLHSIAVTGPVVYVGGHQRWLDNPQGLNNAGPGAVARPGIGAISASSGRAVAWNPGKERGVGAKVLYATSTGLWVGSDTRLFNGQVRDSIAYCRLP